MVRVPSHTGPGEVGSSRHAHSRLESRRNTCPSPEPGVAHIVSKGNTSDDPLMLRFVVIAILTLFASACSRTEFAYRNADGLLQYYAWKTVSTSTAQRDHWQPVLRNTLRRHRELELPFIVAYLDLAGRSIRETGSSAGAACLVDGALFLYQRHTRLAVDLAAPLFAELNASQIEHLARYTAQRQQKAVKRYLDADPQRRKTARQERITKRIEKWTGKLNDGQRQQVKDVLERIPDLSASWLSNRAQRTDTLLTMLESGATTEALRQFLDGWWVHRDGTSAETRRSWQVARQEFIQLMDDLGGTLTDTQRSKLEHRLERLRADLATFLPGRQQPLNLDAVPACESAPA